MEMEFIQWMKWQKKSNNTHFAESSIRTYCDNLRTTASKLIPSVTIPNLFFAQNIRDLLKIRSEIEISTNYEAVNKNTDHASFSAAMDKYQEFLKNKQDCEVFEKKITAFALGFIKHLKSVTTCEDTSTDGNVQFGVAMDGGYTLKFMINWSRKYKRKYYFILYKDTSYIWELFLCRILFHKNGKITWYLDIPSNTTIYKQTMGKEINIPMHIQEDIKKQQEKIHLRQFGFEKKGFLLGYSKQANEIYDKLSKLLFAYLKAGSNSDDSGSEYLEGLRKESKINRCKRSRKYIAAVRKRDENTCQICGYHVSIDGKPVIHVHHKKPLRQITKTNIGDLVCLCPNCHFMAHSKRPIPYTIEELLQKLN